MPIEDSKTWLVGEEPMAETVAIQPVLACRIRKKTHGRMAHSPLAGEVELENISGTRLEISVKMTLFQYLDLIVRDESGKVISEGYYGDIFSPLEKVYTIRLQPGEKYIGPVSLLGNVAPEKQRPGNYTVQAVFEYNGLRALSEPFPVSLLAKEE
jgi:hypothetical protein